MTGKYEHVRLGERPQPSQELDQGDGLIERFATDIVMPSALESLRNRADDLRHGLNAAALWP